jgi:Flp pilus assembly pilin Flp
MNPSPTTVTAAPNAADPAVPDPAPGLDWSDETGAQTAEYGIVTLAAVGFAGVLAVVLAGTDVKGLLLDIVKNALSFG